MPTYVYKCLKCRKSAEVFHSISEIENPLPETLSEITCHKHGVMQRVPQVPQLMGFDSSGRSVSEKELLKKKQKSLKERSHAHFANEGYKDVRDPLLKEQFKRKIKTDPKYTKHKGKDHEKMKPK